MNRSARWTFPVLFAAAFAIFSAVLVAKGEVPNTTQSFIPTIYSQAVGVTSRNGHYLNGDPADTLQAGLTASSQTETTSVFPIWGARQIVVVVRDSVPSAAFVDSMQVQYSLSWDGVASGANWTKPRTVSSASYSQWNPALPDTFQIAVRGRVDTTIAVSASARTSGGYLPIYFAQHPDSTTVNSMPHWMTYPYMRLLFTPKARIRGCVAAGCGVLTLNAPLVGLRVRVHVLRDQAPQFFGQFK